MRKSVYFFLGLFLFIIWASWADLSPSFASFFLSASDKKLVSMAGSWGDSFGAFNALVSVGAFVTVFATLQLQFKALTDQAKDTHRQRFESSFYELLRLMKEARANLSFSLSKEFREKRREWHRAKGTTIAIAPIKREGLSAIQEAVTEVSFWIIDSGKGAQIEATELGEIYTKRVHLRFEATIAPYFRLIYTILYKIKNDNILTKDEKAYYGNLLRSQMTTYEVTLMAINALAPVAKDFRDLITHFRMLKYLPDNTSRRRLAHIYPPLAFQSRE